MTGQLWREYSDKVCNYFKRRVHERELACDLMQDTFQNVLASRDSLNEVQNHEAWIFRIARNRLIDYSRKKREDRLGESVLPGGDEHTADSGSEIEKISECLQELIREYSPEEQDVLYRVFTKSLSQKEAAAYLDLPYSTFKSRVQKARREIISRFQDRCCRLKHNRDGDIIGCAPLRG